MSQLKWCYACTTNLFSDCYFQSMSPVDRKVTVIPVVTYFAIETFDIYGRDVCLNTLRLL